MGSRGYAGASVQSIAREAGLTPGLVHYHFAGKQEILLELARNLADRVRARFEARCGPTDTAWNRLDAFIDAHLETGEDADPEAVRCWVAVGAEALRRPELREIYGRTVREETEVLRGLVRAVFDEERRPQTGTESVAAGLLAAIYGCFQLSALGSAIPKNSAAATVRAMARGLLRSPSHGEQG